MPSFSQTKIALREFFSPSLTFWLVLALLWGQLFFVCAATWLAQETYEYAWLIPPLLVFFLFRRDEIRFNPDHFQPRLVGGERVGGNPRSWAVRWLLLALGLGVFLWALRVVETVDPYWRLALWVHASLVVLISAAWCFWVWRPKLSLGLRLLPLVFLSLLAVPLPTGLEVWLVEAFTDTTMALGVGWMELAGRPVERVGRWLVSMGEQVEVTEGCSGIRSFQSLLFVAVALGEMMTLRWWGRFLLIPLAALLTLVSNFIRVVCLAETRWTEGPVAFQRLHDSITPWTFSGACLALVVVAAWIRRCQSARKRVQVISSQEKVGQTVAESLTANPRAETENEGMPTHPLRRNGWKLAFLVSAGVVVIEVGRLSWFRQSNEAAETEKPFALEKSPRLGLKLLEVGSAVREAYAGGEVSSGVYLQDGVEAEVYLIHWEDASSSGWYEIGGHDPSVCMESVGSKEEKVYPPWIASQGKASLIVRPALYRSVDGKKVYLFEGLWFGWRAGDALAFLGSGDLRGLRFAIAASRTLKFPAIRLRVGVRFAQGYPEARAFFEEVVLTAVSQNF
ncbi:MAG: exosortase/archaeosortase family protein [Verrucomicrobiota bacterium]